MKKITSFILAFALLLCALPFVSACAQGTTYYLDSENGSDSNDGLSQGTAWKTLTKASGVTYGAGDKLLLKAGGIFSGSFETHGSGTEESPVTVSSYGDTASLGNPLIRSDENVILMYVLNVSHWDISNIDFTAPEGRGLYVLASMDSIVKDISITNCHFSEIYNRECPYCDHLPISIASSGVSSRVDGVTVRDCSIENCAFGIAMHGLTYEWAPNDYVSPEVSYNRNFVIDSVSLRNIHNDGIIIGSVYGLHICNCSLIDTSTSEDHYTAPMWSHHASNYLIENCEIAGSTNINDGMAVDFDGWTTDATYQYIYSHDNARFIRNCCYDNYTKNDNCTVRYCLSVNDNMGDNELAQMLSSSSVNYAEDEHAEVMTGFKFYNNTIVNASSFKLCGLKDAVIANNIFTGSLSTSFLVMRKSIGDDDQPVIRDFTGTITNNCFSGTAVPFNAKKSILGNPGFAGTDYDDMNSFKLSQSSKLIGKGIQVEDDMGETDLFGNPLTGTHNIGCYEGGGEQSGGAGFLDDVWAFISSVLGLIYNFIDNCNNRYWIF